MIDDRDQPTTLRSMYRSSRAVPSSRLFHSSLRCLNIVQPRPTPGKPEESSERQDSTRTDGEPALSHRLREATSLLQGYITKATGDTAIGIRKRADEFTVVSQALFSELGGQLNRATGYGEIELLKKKVEVQGMPFVTNRCYSYWCM
jgi:hypothetical protein